VGRDSFLGLLASLLKDQAWVDANLAMKNGTCLIMRGASRTALGESISISCDSRGVKTISTLEPVSHEEADTSIVCGALQQALQGRTVLLGIQDYDSLMAAYTGLAVSVSAAALGTAQDAMKDVVKRIHAECPAWWVREDGRRYAKASPSAAEQQMEHLQRSEVLHIGQIVLELMTGETNLSWLEEGAARALTLAWSVGYFGGDTVPKIHGFTPRTGYDALQFAQRAIGPRGIQPGDCAGDGPCQRTAKIGAELIKAAHYLRRKTTFDTGTTEATEWVANKSLVEMAQFVFDHIRELPMQMQSQDQVRRQCAASH
jgi:hypothetical protein